MIKILRIISLNISVLICCFSILGIIFDCGRSNENYEISYPVVDYYSSFFVTQDYLFGHDGLKRPTVIRENPINKEIYVIDELDNCVYTFSSEGKFIQKIGRPGQGPGDLLRPIYIDIDSKGDLYVYEDKNNRISIISNEGKFIKSIRVMGRIEQRFTVTPNREVLINLPNSGYYFSIYSREGDLIKNIGEITKYSDIEYINTLFAEGWPFIDERGQYYIFFQHMPLVKIFNENGILLQEINLEIIPEIKDKIEERYIPPEKHKLYGDVIKWLFHEIIFKNNHFYVLINHFKEINGRKIGTINLYKFNKNFNIVKKFNLITKENLTFNNKNMWKFEIINNEREILFPFSDGSAILKFTVENMLKK